MQASNTVTSKTAALFSRIILLITKLKFQQHSMHTHSSPFIQQIRTKIHFFTGRFQVTTLRDFFISNSRSWRPVRLIPLLCRKNMNVRNMTLLVINWGFFSYVFSFCGHECILKETNTMCLKSSPGHFWNCCEYFFGKSFCLFSIFFKDFFTPEATTCRNSVVAKMHLF